MTTGSQRHLSSVDERGRISLAKYGLRSTDVVIDELPEGGILIQPAVVMTEAEAAHYRNPEAQEALARGLEDAREGRTSHRELRT